MQQAPPSRQAAFPNICVNAVNAVYCSNINNDRRSSCLVPVGSYSTSDLSRKSGDIIADALRHPVTITQRNKLRLVLLNIDDYERLVRQSDARAVGTIEMMPDSLFDEFQEAVESYAQEDEKGRS